jgi:toxin ParE1/3/4
MRQPRVALFASGGRDLEKINTDISAAGGEAVARNFLARLRASLEKLPDFPRLGRQRPRFGRGVRSWAYAPYIAFYRATGEGVEIIRIIHGRRRITRETIESEP